MKRPAKNRKGQFIVAAAMFIALIILSMSLLIYSAGSRYQTLEKEPVREIVQTITDDFKRMITIALTDYNYSKDPNGIAFNEIVSGWANKTIYCYSGMGLQLMISGVDVYEKNSLEEDSFEIGARATLKMNIISLGFYGYEYPLQIKLNVTIDSVKYTTGGSGKTITSLNITVTAFKEKNLPVSDLEITNLNVILSNSSGSTEEKDITNLLDITYVSGEGLYIITLKEDQTITPTNPKFGKITGFTVTLEFKDGRGIQGYAQKDGVKV